MTINEYASQAFIGWLPDLSAAPDSDTAHAYLAMLMEEAMIQDAETAADFKERFMPFGEAYFEER